MYEKILKKNENFIISQKSFRKYTHELQSLVRALNKDKIVTLSGIRHSWKTKLLCEFLTKTKSQEDCFYHNSEVDTLWLIHDEKNLMTLMDIHVRIHGIPKIVILQNTNNVVWIKQFIQKLYKTKKYKIIIAGNNIKIDGVEDIKLYPLGIHSQKISEMKYGWIPEVRIIPDTSYKSFLLEALKHDIISRDILEAYTVKNIPLFYKVLGYLAENSEYQSLREIHRNLARHEIDLSLLTMIDYINAALNTDIIHRCYRYDFKNQKTISSKVQYFFGDTGIRYSFCWDDFNYLENSLYLELISKWYEVFWGTNGRFDFALYAKKWNSSLAIALADVKDDKNEVRKTARKLGKLSGDIQKYVVVENKESLKMRKFEEDGVQIVELSELLGKID